jgi:tRNA(fMet)-specific endonuclease VapC
MRFLLDTNILSDLVRRPHGVIADRIQQIGDQAVCTSVIVTAELRYGAAKKASARLSAQLETILAAIDILAFEPPADQTYGVLRASLDKSGQVIGGNDLLIAAQAVSLGYTLVTDNEREFSRINQLRFENWLQSP